MSPLGVDYLGEYRVDWTNSIEEGTEHPLSTRFLVRAQLVVIDA